MEDYNFGAEINGEYKDSQNAVKPLPQAQKSEKHIYKPLPSDNSIIIRESTSWKFVLVIFFIIIVVIASLFLYLIDNDKLKSITNQNVDIEPQIQINNTINHEMNNDFMVNVTVQIDKIIINTNSTS